MWSDFLLVVVGAVLALFGQWVFYRYQKRDEQHQGPKVIIGRVQKQGQVMLELRNAGQDSLRDMVVHIDWTQDHQAQTKMLDHFILPKQDVTGPAMHVELLGPDDRYHVIGLPEYTDDRVVRVRVTGVGVQSGLFYETQEQVELGLPASH